MFTGIVSGLGKVAEVVDRDSIRTFVIDFPEGFCDGLTIGASVAVDGVCLTVTKINSPVQATLDVIYQTLKVTTLGGHVVGESVNVERACRDGAEIGGHPLSGHIDFSAMIERVAIFEGNKVLRFGVPSPFAQYIFAKGYIAINGASLTISDVGKNPDWFEVWLIPETRRATTFDHKSEGNLVNVEIERGTQVVVDTIKASVAEGLGRLQPLIESLLLEKGLTISDLIEMPRLTKNDHSKGA